MDVYQENGYRDRAHYLKCLADDYGVPFENVITLAVMLGPNEDFDGLVTTVSDMADQMIGE